MTLRMFFCTESDLPGPGDLQDVLDDGLDVLLDEYNGALDRGFKRRERLDVKKPGPYFSTNNYAFHRSEAPDEQENKQVSQHNVECASAVSYFLNTRIELNRTYINTQSVPRSKHTQSQL
jgi:hypothetical protein